MRRDSIHFYLTNFRRSLRHFQTSRLFYFSLSCFWISFDLRGKSENCCIEYFLLPSRFAFISCCPQIMVYFQSKSQLYAHACVIIIYAKEMCVPIWCICAQMCRNLRIDKLSFQIYTCIYISIRGQWWNYKGNYDE